MGRSIRWISLLNAGCELIVDSFETSRNPINNFPIFLSNAYPACISADIP